MKNSETFLSKARFIFTTFLSKVGEKIKCIWLSVSTRPHYESYAWGKHFSILSKVTYFGIYFLRWLSPLQWFKSIYRCAFKSSQNDPKERKDFHAFHTEIYLLCVLFGAIVYYYFGSDFSDWLSQKDLKGWILIPLSWLLLESVVWVFYYMLLRILIEKHLSIFNEAEYLIALPVVLLSQFFLAAGLLDVDVREIVSLALNLDYDSYKTSESIRLTIGVLGYVYTVLIIANIINIIPAIPVSRRPNVTIVGAGDVVSQRILPAIMQTGLYSANQLTLVSDVIDDQLKTYLRAHHIVFHEVGMTQTAEKKVMDVVNFVKKRSSYAIIATPTQSHLDYALALSQASIAFALEKPLVATSAELDIVTRCDEQLMKKGFLLSYYWLEKALPLNYFFNLTPQYRKFLGTENPDVQLPDSNALAYLRLRLGKVTGIKIRFFEGEDLRPWSLTKETGGFYFETLIHPITLLLNVVDQPFKLSDLNAQWSVFQELPNKFVDNALPIEKFGASFVTISCKSNAFCKVDIKAGKFLADKRRILHMTFEQGTLEMNLDTLCCVINPVDSSLNTCTIKVKAEYGGALEGQQSNSLKYAVQMNLFDSFIHNQGAWHSQRFDDYPQQKVVLAAMMEWLKYQDGTSHFYKPQILNEAEYIKLAQEN